MFKQNQTFKCQLYGQPVAVDFITVNWKERNKLKLRQFHNKMEQD